MKGIGGGGVSLNIFEKRLFVWLELLDDQRTRGLMLSFRQGLIGDGALNNQRRVEFPDILKFKIWTFAAQEDHPRDASREESSDDHRPETAAMRLFLDSNSF